MIKYNLLCKCGQTFESWFSGSAEYDALRKKKLINCIYCDSTSIKKSIMSPNLFGKSNKISKKTASQKKIKKQLTNLRKYIEKNCKYVGDNATTGETAELLEEGIEVATIPWIDKSEN